MKIPGSVRPALYRYLGEKTDGFLTDAGENLEGLAARWGLSCLELMPTNTVNLLFTGQSRVYGACVLKLCIPGPEVATEINCLRAYGARGYCRLLEYDLRANALLLERILPGSQLWAVDDYPRRAALFANTLRDLPALYDSGQGYPTYLSWLEAANDTLAASDGMEDILRFLDKAMEIYRELKLRYPRACLLHGDLHHENLLLNQNGGYTAIDPKGVVDDPVMESARFLMNESMDRKSLLDMAGIIGRVIKIPPQDILRAMFIDAALGQSWRMQEHYENRPAFELAKANAVEICSFVYGLITRETG